MALVMVRPNWPSGQFQRTINLGTDKKPKPKLLKFNKTEPVEVTDAELNLLGHELGKAIFEVVRDEKNRVRFVETEKVAAESPTEDPDKKPPETSE